MQPNGQPASSTGFETWRSVDAVVAAAENFDGVGFVFTPGDPYCGIDLDGCRDPVTGKAAEWAREIVTLFATYTEVSPSQTGVKLFLRGKLPFDSGKKRPVQADRVCDKDPAVEAYDHGRYFAVTGLRVAGLPHEPQDRQEILDQFCRDWFGETAEATQRSAELSSRLSVIERAGRYLDTIPGAVAGQGGHSVAFKAACCLVLGFGLTPSEALVLLAQWNARCSPPWSEKELRHKIASADKQPGPRGQLRDSDRPESVALPKWTQPGAPSIRQPEAEEERDAPKITTMREESLRYLENLKAGKCGLIDTGLPELDYAIGGGLSKNEMVVVCARPSHGKTAFALQALDAMVWAGKPSAFVTEEMAPVQLGKRTIQFGASTPQEHWLERMEDVLAEVAKHYDRRATCHVVECCGTVARVSEVVRRLVNEHGVEAVAIDYAQLLTGSGRDAYQQITAVCKALRRLANDLPILLYVLCQSSREIEGRKSFIPMMKDIKETGQFEQDADVILFPVWPHRLDAKNPANEYQIHVLKNRNRAINDPCVYCQFDPSRQRIRERTNTEQAKASGNYVKEFDSYNDKIQQEAF